MDLPPKAAGALLKAVARHTLFGDVTLTLEDVSTAILAPAGFPDPVAHAAVVGELQRCFATAAYYNLTPMEVATWLDGTAASPLSAGLKETVVAYWREVREEVRAHVVMREVGRSHALLRGVAWRLQTPTAGEDTAGVARGEMQPHVTLSVRVGAPVNPTPTAGAVEAEKEVHFMVTKAGMAGLLHACSNMRAELERAATTSTTTA